MWLGIKNVIRANHKFSNEPLIDLNNLHLVYLIGISFS